MGILRYLASNQDSPPDLLKIVFSPRQSTQTDDVWFIFLFNPFESNDNTPTSTKIPKPPIISVRGYTGGLVILSDRPLGFSHTWDSSDLSLERGRYFWSGTRARFNCLSRPHQRRRHREEKGNIHILLFLATISFEIHYTRQDEDTCGLILQYLNFFLARNCPDCP